MVIISIYTYGVLYLKAPDPRASDFCDSNCLKGNKRARSANTSKKRWSTSFRYFIFLKVLKNYECAQKPI